MEAAPHSPSPATPPRTFIQTGPHALLAVGPPAYQIAFCRAPDAAEVAVVFPDGSEVDFPFECLALAALAAANLAGWSAHVTVHDDVPSCDVLCAVVEAAAHVFSVSLRAAVDGEGVTIFANDTAIQYVVL